VAREAAQPVGIARHAVGLLAKAPRLPHKPQAAGCTLKNPAIGKEKDDDGDTQGRDSRWGHMPQQAGTQDEDEEAEDEQIAVGLTAEPELRGAVAANQLMDQLGGQGRYLPGRLVYVVGCMVQPVI
jgi:hypothetical protein